MTIANEAAQYLQHCADEFGCQGCEFELERELGPVQGPPPAPSRYDAVRSRVFLSPEEWAR